MGLFSKKSCDICGGEIGMLGNRKLEDGNMCKKCAQQLSPWFSDRKSSTISEIKAQLDYRENNKSRVAAFNVTRTLGTGKKVYIDEQARTFMVTGAANLMEANPDVIDASAITDVRTDVHEMKTELKTKDAQGNQVSYNPPRYRYSYDFYVIINVNHPYFDNLRFNPTNGSIGVEQNFASMNVRQTPVSPRGRTFGMFNPAMDAKYVQAQNMCEEIKTTLLNLRSGVNTAYAPQNAYAQSAANAYAQTAAAPSYTTCPWCGTNVPAGSGSCSACGGPL